MVYSPQTDVYDRSLGDICMLEIQQTHECRSLVKIERYCRIKDIVTWYQKPWIIRWGELCHNLIALTQFVRVLIATLFWYLGVYPETFVCLLHVPEREYRSFMLFFFLLMRDVKRDSFANIERSK